MLPAPTKTPRWFAAIVIVVLLPLFQFPWLLERCSSDSGARTMLWIYPFYALTAGYLAWQCYPQRRALAWLLLALLVFSHLAIWILVTTPIENL